MPLFLIVSEIYGRKVSKWWKIRNFFELFGPPCRNALAALDGSTSDCAQVCALHIGLHLASLRKTEMLAVLCTNETTPQFFEFITPPPPAPQGPMGTTGGGGTSADIAPTQIIFGVECGSVHALLRYRSKTAKMQKKIPIGSNSNENFISPFFRPPGAANPQKGRRHVPIQATPACKIWRESTRGLLRNRWPNKQTNKQTYSKTNTSPFALRANGG